MMQTLPRAVARSAMRIAAVLVALTVAALAAGPALAGGTVSAADQTAMQALITNQIDAFRHDNGATAYADASPEIHNIFPTVDAFMAMVRSGYQPVYRPQSVIFGDMIQGDGGPMQKVYVTGPDGKDYVAVYSFERQPDGSWKISGCSLVPADTPSI
jgi:hypothetical protein